MPIPTASVLVFEFLRQLSDGNHHERKVIEAALQDKFLISETEAVARIPSGRETVLTNRFRNAEYSMKRRGLAHFTPDGRKVVITAKGIEYLGNI